MAANVALGRRVERKRNVPYNTHKHTHKNIPSRWAPPCEQCVCVCAHVCHWKKEGLRVLVTVEQCQSCKTICNNLLYSFKGERTDAKSILRWQKNTEIWNPVLNAEFEEKQRFEIERNLGNVLCQMYMIHVC